LEKEPPLDEREKARWRKKAVEWLKADLARRAEQARAGTPGARADVAQKLLQWKSDPDLAGIRDDKELARLPEGERAAFKRLWDDVNQLLAEVSGGK
jgi:hypothetical protein